MKKYLRLGAAIAVLAASSMTVQSVAASAYTGSVAVRPAAALTLEGGTSLTLVTGEDVTSTSHREGDQFKLSVLHDVKIGDTVVIPRGTPAMAEITWRTGKGAFGKSGKIEFSLLYIDLNGQRIPLTGDYRQEGEGNTVATGVGIIAVGVFAGFITGKRAKLPAGRELAGRIASSVPFNADGSLHSSYDSAGAMTTATLATRIGKCRAEAAALSSKGKQQSAAKKCYQARL
jgi:hypothetical protein